MISSYQITRGDVFTRYTCSTVSPSLPPSSSPVYIYLDYSATDPTPHGTLYCTPYSSFTRLLDRSNPRDSSFPLHLLREVVTGDQAAHRFRELRDVEGRDRCLALLFERGEKEPVHPGNSLFLLFGDRETLHTWVEGLQDLLAAAPKNVAVPATEPLPRPPPSVDSSPAACYSAEPSSTQQAPPQSTSPRALDVSSSSSSSSSHPFTLPSLDARNEILLPNDQNYMTTLERGVRAQQFVGDEKQAEVREIWLKVEKQGEGDRSLSWAFHSDNHLSHSHDPSSSSATSAASSGDSLSASIPLSFLHTVQMNKHVPELHSPAASFFAPNQCCSFIFSSSVSPSHSTSSFSAVDGKDVRLSVAFESLPSRATFLLALDHYFRKCCNRQKKEDTEKERFDCAIQ
jgi:hypothetical protein